MSLQESGQPAAASARRSVLGPSWCFDVFLSISEAVISEECRLGEWTRAVAFMM
jgi:hypothetical protein